MESFYLRLILSQRSSIAVSESGGASSQVTTLDGSRAEIAHLWPQFLPDGKHFLYLAFGSAPGGDAIYAASLDSKETKLILKNDTDAIYASPGYLLFNRQGTLMAQPFDAARLQLGGEAVPIAEGVQAIGITGRAAFTVSEQRRAGLSRGRRNGSSDARLGESQWDGAAHSGASSQLRVTASFTRWTTSGRRD